MGDTMKISHVRIYDIEDTITESGLAKSAEPEYSLERATTLGNAKLGTAHNSYLKGIVVRHRIQADHSFWMQYMRYHFHDSPEPITDIVCSTSKMHMITNSELVWHHLVSKEAKIIVEELIKIYNGKTNEIESATILDAYGINVKNKAELFEAIIMNCPIGLELKASIITTYLQLKSMYVQRRPHKMSSWQQYCDWIETLPLQTLITVHK